MIQGLYTASSGMLAGMTEQARIAHNLTNSETIGYKAFDVSLAEYGRVMEEYAATGRMGGDGVSLEERTDFSQGPLVMTGRELDVAVAGPGFLTVRSVEGDHYTRAGRLHRNADGLLITSEGFAVVGEAGPITLPPGTVRIAEDGLVTVDGATVDQLLLVEFEDPAALTRIGGTMFAATPGEEGAQPLPADASRIQQGYVESSNVDLTQSMTSLVSVSRLYQLSQRLALQQSELLEQTINDVARL